VATVKDDLDESIVDTTECAEFMRTRLEQSIALFVAKNPPYGNSAIKGVQRYGLESAVWRLADKFNRVESLIYGTENTVPEEKLEDTLFDLANYSMIMAYAIIKLKGIKIP